MREIWRDVPGFGGHYEASSLGRIRSKERVVTKKTRHGGVMEQRYEARILSQINNKGYRRVRVGFDNKKMNVSVHTMVLLAFHGPKPEGHEGCHRNGSAADNRECNLRWGTPESNAKDRKAHGNYAECENHFNAKLTLERVAKIRSGLIGCTEAQVSYGISEGHFYRILKGHGWAGVAV